MTEYAGATPTTETLRARGRSLAKTLAERDDPSAKDHPEANTVNELVTALEHAEARVPTVTVSRGLAPGETRETTPVNTKGSSWWLLQAKDDNDWWHLIVLGVVALLGVLPWVNTFLVGDGPGIMRTVFKLGYVALLGVAIADVFLIALVISVVRKCRYANPEIWPGIPNRETAALVFVGLYICFIAAFAQMNRDFLRPSEGGSQAFLFEAFLTVATLEHEHFRLSTQGDYIVVVVQLVSVVLLFFTYFPLLLGRLIMFKGEGTTLTHSPLTLTSDVVTQWKLGDVDIEKALNTEIKVDTAIAVETPKPSATRTPSA